MDRPTIAELEAILEEKDVKIEILPSGEVQVLDPRLERIAALQAQLAEAEKTRLLMHVELATLRVCRTELVTAEAQLAETKADIEKHVRVMFWMAAIEKDIGKIQAIETLSVVPVKARQEPTLKLIGEHRNRRRRDGRGLILYESFQL